MKFKLQVRFAMADRINPANRIQNMMPKTEERKAGEAAAQAGLVPNPLPIRNQELSPTPQNQEIMIQAAGRADSSVVSSLVIVLPLGNIQQMQKDRNVLIIDITNIRAKIDRILAQMENVSLLRELAGGFIEEENDEIDPGLIEVAKELGLSNDQIKEMSPQEINDAYIDLYTKEVGEQTTQLTQKEAQLTLLNQHIAQAKAFELAQKLGKGDGEHEIQAATKQIRYPQHDPLVGPKVLLGVRNQILHAIDGFIRLGASGPAGETSRDYDQKMKRREEEKEKLHDRREAQVRRKEVLADYRDAEWQKQEIQLNIILGKFSEIKIGDYATISTDRLMDQLRSDKEELSSIIDQAPSAIKKGLKPLFNEIAMRLEAAVEAEKASREYSEGLLHSGNGDRFIPKYFTGNDQKDRILDILVFREELKRDLDRIGPDPIGKQSRGQRMQGLEDLNQVLGLNK
jgi:hypothetical protein